MENRDVRDARPPTSEVVYDETWRHDVLGAKLDVDLRIVPRARRGVMFQLGGRVGRLVKSWRFGVAGDLTAEKLDIAFGMRLGVSISGWRAVPGQVCFDLSVRVTVPHGEPIVLVSERIVLPLPRP